MSQYRHDYDRNPQAPRRGDSHQTQSSSSSSAYDTRRYNNNDADRRRDPQAQYDSDRHYHNPSSPSSYSSQAPPAPPPNKWTAAAQAAENHHTGMYDGGSSTGYRTWENVDDEPEDYENTEWLDRKTKKVQNESLMSTRRAVEKLHAADAVATENMTKLNYQGEQLYKAEGRLESAQSHVKVSDAKADHLKSLNRFFMIPSFGSGKAKRREALAKQEQREREARDEERRLDEQNRSERANRLQDIQDRDYSNRGAGMYTTPDGLERNDTEVEIDRNLDQLSSGLAKLKMMGQMMNTELDAQTGQVNRIMDRSDSTHDRLNVTTNKVQRMLR
ncbi:Protein transport protein S9 plasma membrane t-SNARE [Geranomyces variabilis]|uniref:Protein transport protein S9 plasma membrane t-SNARE n=1 Tax=Geranomyces variabilis TaxID=109894 RepID=A0AAD5XKV2_9FUNG|nr:Protein transport protein S9 plasma membrane t-SNARE [Geranomyces variabilis]